MQESTQVIDRERLKRRIAIPGLGNSMGVTIPHKINKIYLRTTRLDHELSRK